LHGITSLKRFYKQNFEDGSKQAAIDLVLGQHTPTQTQSLSSGEFAEAALLAEEGKYTSREAILLATATWHVDGYEHCDMLDLRATLLSFQEPPDLVVVGLQALRPTTSTSGKLGQRDSTAHR